MGVRKSESEIGPTKTRRRRPESCHDAATPEQSRGELTRRRIDTGSMAMMPRAAQTAHRRLGNRKPALMRNVIRKLR